MSNAVLMTPREPKMRPKPEMGSRRSRLELGHERLASDEEPDLPEMREHADRCGAEHDRSGGERRLDDRRRDVRGDVLRAHRLHVLAAERLRQHRRERREHRLDARGEDEHGAEEEHRVRSVLRAGDVALLASLAAALRRCVLRALAEILSHADLPPPQRRWR